MKSLIYGASFLSLVAQPLAANLEYDPDEAIKIQRLNTSVMQTKTCLRDGEQAVLMQGLRDQEKIVDFATGVCGGSLTTVMTNLGEPPERVRAFIRSLAYEQLRYIPGLKQ